MTRRTFAAVAAALPAALSTASAAPRTAVGVGTASCFNRIGHERRTNAAEPFGDTVNFLEYWREAGAGGVQAALTSTESRFTKQVRRISEEAGMYYEASGRLPRSDSDLEEFRDYVKGVRDAGGSVMRTVLFNGRRYETHDSMETYRQAYNDAWKMITLAEPTLRKLGVKAAIENHKFLRAADFHRMMERIQSEYVGVTFDFGNNYVLMEDPVDLARELAPYALASHIKDHRLQEYEDGFLLFDAQLGTGIIDLPKVIQTLRAANPNIKFTLETMTRDALEVPYLRDKYWATFREREMDGRDVAKTIATIKATQTAEPFPKISALSIDERIALEDENNRAGLAYAREKLGLYGPPTPAVRGGESVPTPAAWHRGLRPGKLDI